MTREEEIQEAAEEYSAYIDSTDEERYNSTKFEAFKDGAKWADEHLYWHNVAENPAKQGVYLVRVEVDVYGTTTPRKFIKYELAPYAEYQGVMKWHTLGFSYPNSRITHWMEIPAVELNIEHPAKKQTVTIDAWVARDSRKDIGKNTDLFFGKEYPILNKMVGTWGGMEEFYPLPQDALPSVTFENSPKKVKVTIELEEE